MKNCILTIATITFIWQPTCVGMLSNTIKPTLEYLLSTAVISNDICKNTFNDTTTPVQNDVIIKYLLVKHVMKDNGLHSLSINTPPFSAIKPIASYDCDSRMWGSGSLHNTIPAFHSCGKNRKLRTFDLNNKPRLQKLPFTFQLSSLSTNDSDLPEQCGKYEYENSQKKNDAIHAAIDFVSKMKLHPDLPPIIALDTFIGHTTRNYK